MAPCRGKFILASVLVTGLQVSQIVILPLFHSGRLLDIRLPRIASTFLGFPTGPTQVPLVVCEQRGVGTVPSPSDPSRCLGFRVTLSHLRTKRGRGRVEMENQGFLIFTYANVDVD